MPQTRWTSCSSFFFFFFCECSSSCLGRRNVPHRCASPNSSRCFSDQPRPAPVWRGTQWGLFFFRLEGRSQPRPEISHEHESWRRASAFFFLLSHAFLSQRPLKASANYRTHTSPTSHCSPALSGLFLTGLRPNFRPNEAIWWNLLTQISDVRESVGCC